MFCLKFAEYRPILNITPYANRNDMCVVFITKRRLQPKFHHADFATKSADTNHESP